MVDPTPKMNKVFCPRCGRDSKKIAIGEMFRAQIPDGRNVYAPVDKQPFVAIDLIDKGLITKPDELDWMELKPQERVPDTEVCPACNDEITRWAKLVSQGGVYFKCKECHTNGVILPGTPMSKAVRAATDADKGAPIGIEFHHCKQHQETIEKDDKGGNGGDIPG